MIPIPTSGSSPLLLFTKMIQTTFLRVLLAIWLLLLSISGVRAQTSDFGNWMIYFGNKQLSKKFNLHHEVQYRNYNAIGDLEQLLLRTGLGYNLSENNNNILVGYGFIRSENYLANASKEIVNEHRVYQQFITKQQFGRFYLQHRYRFEQRFIETAFRLRFRYFLAANVVLNRPQLEKKAVYLSAYNELFIQPSGTKFDRNRLYGGIGYVFNPKLRAEIGYMNQFLNASQRDQLNIVAYFNF